MKAVKSITLFIIFPSLMLTMGFWAGVRASRFFYPGELQPGTIREQEKLSGTENEGKPAAEVSQREETLSVETEYVLKENDILRETAVETAGRLPDKYVGMNREQFIECMETYESSPPLSELERGFVSLEVLSFSRARVVVQMNYRYLQPGAGYYLAVRNNEVVVLLEDMKTVYIYTGIRLDYLPQDVQEDIIQMRFVEDEGRLYSFLETYSS